MDRSVDSWAEVIAGLERDRTAAQADLFALDAEARPLALPATTGDAQAAAALGELEDQRGKLSRRIATLDAALEDAGVRQAAAQQAVADAQAAARLERQRELALVVREAAAAADTAARTLAQAMAGYAAAVDTLRRAGLQNPYGTKLLNRTMLAGALHLAGVSAVVPLPPVHPGHRRTLADWSAAMTAHLDPPPAADPAPPTAEAA